MLQVPPPGIGFVPEYQVSSLPWVTASVHPGTVVRHDFPTVTRFVRVSNSNASGGAEVRVGFSPFVSASNYLAVYPQQSVELQVRCTSLYVQATSGSAYQVLAGLTGIPTRMMLPISGSNV